MDRLQSMRVFEQVVAENGFAAGARKLGLAPATATRLVRDPGGIPGRAAAAVAVSPAITSNDHEAVLRSTLEGAGISSQAMQVAAPLLRSGRLQRVLAPWLAERFTLLASFASRRLVPTRTRAFLDHLIKQGALAKAGAVALQP